MDGIALNTKHCASLKELKLLTSPHGATFQKTPTFIITYHTAPKIIDL
jgi:hypothetical protein